MDAELFELFVKHTNEKKIILKKIIEIVKPKKTQTFLDCGCGTGEITIPLSKLVKKTVAVDIDDAILKKISEKGKIEFIQSKIEDLDLKEKFDFVVMSHIWRHIKFENRGNIIRKILSYLKKNGKLILVCSGESECKLIEIFGPRMGFKPLGGVKKLIEILNNLNLKFKNYKVHTKTWAKSVNEMFKIKSYFVFDKRDRYFELEKEIKNYLRKFLKNNKIVIRTSSHILVINKD